VVRVRYRNTDVAAWTMENFSEPLVSESEQAGRVIAVSGRGQLATLEGGRVYPADLADVATKARSFENMTKAGIFLALYEEFQARGGGELTPSFTAALNSNGTAWTDEVSLSYQAGQSLLKVIQNLAAFGIDVWADVNGGLHALPARGIDKSSWIIFREGQAILSATKAQEGTLLANAVLAEGDASFYESTDSASIAEYHRREYHLPIQNTDDLRVLLQANSLFLATRKEPAYGYTLKVLASPFEPFLDYEVGDTITLDMTAGLGGAPTSFRVLQIAIEELDEGRLTVTLGINDVQTEYWQRLQRAFDASLLMAKPVDTALTTANGGSAVTRLWVGYADGPRLGILAYRNDDNVIIFTFEAVDTANVPFFSLGMGDNTDRQAIWGRFGYEDTPNIRMETVEGWDRKIPLVDLALLRGAAEAADGQVPTADGAGGVAWEALTVGAGGINSGAAEDGQVLTADGAGGAAWEDVTMERELLIPLDGLARGAAAPDAAILGNYFGYAYKLNDDGFFSFEAPADWDGASDFLVSLHWTINEAYALQSAEVRWQIQWSATPEDGGEALDAPTHGGTLNSGDVNIPATAKHLVETQIAIPHASLALHDVVGVQLKRVALGDGTDPTAKPTVIAVEIEYTAVLT
jgi:hypothetical protein